MKATYQEIKDIANCTPKELAGKSTTEIGPYEIVGYYRPSNANWSFQVAVVVWDGSPLEVVLQFGHIWKR